MVSGQTGRLEVGSTSLCLAGVDVRFGSKSGHQQMPASCPLYPRKRTLIERVVMSALCQKRTHAVRQRKSLFDYFVGYAEHACWRLMSAYCRHPLVL
jgi:hypothetical protein